MWGNIDFKDTMCQRIEKKYIKITLNENRFECFIFLLDISGALTLLKKLF